MKTFVAARKTVSTDDLALAFATASVGMVENHLAGAMNMASFWPNMAPHVMNVMSGVANAVRTVDVEVRQVTSARRATVVLPKFDAVNPQAVAWAEAHAAEMIREISDESRMALRRIVTDSYALGIPPRDAARLIEGVIGLNENQALAVLNFRFRMLEASPGTLVKAGAMRFRVPAKGFTSDQLASNARKYSDRLLRQRAKTIARDQILRIANEGQRQLWLQAITKGELSAKTKRTWIATGDERTCQICGPLDGETVGMLEPFSGGYFNPPAHTQCRCTTGLA